MDGLFRRAHTARARFRRPRRGTNSRTTPSELSNAPPAAPGCRSPGRGNWFWSLVALGAIAVLLLGLTGWLYRQDHADNAARADRDNVVLAARQGVLNLIELSHTDAEAAYARLVQGTTGALRDQLTQQAASVT
ncbi:hypothetical protein [Amycolatopsis thermoflava]|uniref:hypothetical protein n=1 Tax=Amycolatopsis thermoflava TaxID=84480 RepID=UPI0038141DB4